MLPPRTSTAFLTLLQITSTAWKWSRAERCCTAPPGWAALPPSASRTSWSTTPCRCWTPTCGPSYAAPSSGPTSAFGNSLSIMNSSCSARTPFTWSVLRWVWFQTSTRKGLFDDADVSYPGQLLTSAANPISTLNAELFLVKELETTF